MLNDAEKLSNLRTGLADYFITGYSFQLSRLLFVKQRKEGRVRGRERREKEREGGKEEEKR